MTIETNWITTELKRLFPRADLKVGVDINRNGRLKPNERIATFNNNTIPGNKSNVIGDWTDWLAFYRHNVAELAKLGGIFGLSAWFKATNPLHAITVIESAMSLPERIKKTYETILTIHSKMRARDSISNTPPEKLLDVYDFIREEKMSFEKDIVLLTEAVHAKKLDCDTSSFIVSAIAYEMGWPVHLVAAPKHIFIRWDNGKTGQGQMRFNFDITGSFTDRQYQKMFNISALAISQGMYLRNLSKQQVIALIFGNRATKKVDIQKYREAIGDFDEAIRLYPEEAAAHGNRCSTHNILGKRRDALKDCDEAIRLDPGNAAAYRNRGYAKSGLGRHQEAIGDFDAAIRLNPKDAMAYTNRGKAKFHLGAYQKAIRDCDEAIRLDHTSAAAYFIRGNAKIVSNKHQEAINDYDEAIRLDPRNATAYLNRGNAKVFLGKHQDAIRDFNEAIRLDPNYAVAYYNRGGAKGRLGRHREAIGDFDAAIRLNPRDAQAYANRSHAKARLGRHAEARKDFAKAKELGLQQ